MQKYLSEAWLALAPALGNHLWQSTFFALAAGLLTMVLRKNHARCRYWLWLAASLKFLVPFSLLVSIGGHLAWTLSPTGPKARLYFVIDEVSRPFAQPIVPVGSEVGSPAVSSILSASQVPTASQILTAWVPVLLISVWLAGFMVLLSAWYLRWRKSCAVIRKAKPLREGREVEALRRLESIGLPRRIEMLLSPVPVEPGIFGIVRPVLVWPEGISEHLDDAHLRAIVAHEVWHVRRHDNLAAAMHMLVEAIFWFHPLVWWLGARLVDERERACDEEVLALGSEPEAYAESILKTCEFCAGFSLACTSGVTGADLERRIVQIMTQCAGRRVSSGKKLLLVAAGVAAIAMPVIFGTLSPARARAESQNDLRAESPGESNPANSACNAKAVSTSKTGPDDATGEMVPSVEKSASAATKRCSKSVRAAKRTSSAPSDRRRER